MKLEEKREEEDGQWETENHNEREGGHEWVDMPQRSVKHDGKEPPRALHTEHLPQHPHHCTWGPKGDALKRVPAPSLG